MVLQYSEFHDLQPKYVLKLQHCSSASQLYDVDQPVVKCYHSCVNCTFWAQLYFKLVVQEIKKMGVVFVCTSNHCCIHLKWVSFSGGYLYKQGQLSLLDNQPEIHCSLQRTTVPLSMCTYKQFQAH